MHIRWSHAIAGNCASHNETPAVAGVFAKRQNNANFSLGKESPDEHSGLPAICKRATIHRERYGSNG